MDCADLLNFFFLKGFRGGCSEDYKERNQRIAPGYEHKLFSLSRVNVPRLPSNWSGGCVSYP